MHPEILECCHWCINWNIKVPNKKCHSFQWIRWILLQITTNSSASNGLPTSLRILIFFSILVSYHFHSSQTYLSQFSGFPIEKVQYSELSQAGHFRGMAVERFHLYFSNHWNISESDSKPKCQEYFITLQDWVYSGQSEPKPCQRRK